MKWHFLGLAFQLPPPREAYLAQMVNAKLLRQLAEVPKPKICHGLSDCPQSGIWEGRVAADHPRAVLYNRWDQQAYVERGRAFPDPKARGIEIALQHVQWTYLGSPNADTGLPGEQHIAL